MIEYGFYRSKYIDGTYNRTTYQLYDYDKVVIEFDILVNKGFTCALLKCPRECLVHSPIGYDYSDTIYMLAYEKFNDTLIIDFHSLTITLNGKTCNISEIKFSN